MSYSYDTRRAISASAARRLSHSPSQRGSGYIPNSSYSGVLDDGTDRETLENTMKSKMQSMFSSAYHNPRAEAEADRIGSRFSDSSGVEDLKARMGSALGADFSGVRFHTGAEAASMAPTAEDSFSAGKDIYMGGSFNPMIAAHEMVHTLQTGAVQSAAAVTSVPSGAVQGWDNLGKKKDKPKGIWGKFKNWVSKKWNHSGMVKAHRKAVDHYNNNTQDYKDMSTWERFKWTLRNPLARMRGGGKTSMAETAQRNANRAEEAKAAKNLSSMWTDKKLGDARGKLNTIQESKIPVEDRIIQEPAEGVMDEDDGMPKEEGVAQDFAGGNIGGGLKDIVGGVTDAVDLANLPLAFVPGMGAISSFVDAGSSFAKTGAAITSAVGNGATKAMLNKRVKNNAEETKKLESRLESGDLSDEERYELTKNRAVQQGSNAAGIRMNEGINDAVSNSIQGTGSTLGGMAHALDAVVPGLGSAIGGAIQLAGIGVATASNKIGKKVINKQKKAFRKNTVNQELDIEGKVAALMNGDSKYTDAMGMSKEEAQNLSKSEAKHIILKSMGFKSGKYKEAFNQITKNRAEALTERANKGNDDEVGIMKSMFLNKVNVDGEKQYSAAGVAQKLGYQVIDPEYFEDNNIFKKKADENRRKKPQIIT